MRLLPDYQQIRSLLGMNKLIIARVAIYSHIGDSVFSQYIANCIIGVMKKIPYFERGLADLQRNKITVSEHIVHDVRKEQVKHNETVQQHILALSKPLVGPSVQAQPHANGTTHNDYVTHFRDSLRCNLSQAKCSTNSGYSMKFARPLSNSCESPVSQNLKQFLYHDWALGYAGRIFPGKYGNSYHNRIALALFYSLWNIAPLKRPELLSKIQTMCEDNDGSKLASVAKIVCIAGDYEFKKDNSNGRYIGAADTAINLVIAHLKQNNQHSAALNTQAFKAPDIGNLLFIEAESLAYTAIGLLMHKIILKETHKNSGALGFLDKKVLEKALDSFNTVLCALIDGSTQVYAQQNDCKAEACAVDLLISEHIEIASRVSCKLKSEILGWGKDNTVFMELVDKIEDLICKIETIDWKGNKMLSYSDVVFKYYSSIPHQNIGECESTANTANHDVSGKHVSTSVTDSSVSAANKRWFGDRHWYTPGNYL